VRTVRRDRHAAGEAALRVEAEGLRRGRRPQVLCAEQRLGQRLGRDRHALDQPRRAQTERQERRQRRQPAEASHRAFSTSKRTGSAETARRKVTGKLKPARFGAYHGKTTEATPRRGTALRPPSEQAELETLH